MLGSDTVLFTPKGFKMLSELNIYDEVMTPYGTFESIIHMSDWQEVNEVVKVSTGELISCDDDVLWNVRIQNKDRFLFTDEIDKEYACGFVEPFECMAKFPLMEGYEFAVVVPTCVPDEYLLSNINNKLSFFAGLVDSPICERTGDVIEKYTFSTQYPELMKGIIKLCRSLGWEVSCNLIDKVYVIDVFITNNYDKIPIKDELKKCNKNNDYLRVRYRTRILDTVEIDDNYKIYGRKIKVNGGSFLIGYSLIPVN